MPIMASAKSGSNYTPAPAGAHSAVCVDVIDLGMLKVEYKGKSKEQHKIKIVWQIDALRDDGKRFIVGKRYTLSLHEKASLRRDLEAWRGRAFTETELDGFDVETVIGIGCLLNLIHNVSPSNGGTYANVASIMRLPRGMPTLMAEDYIRVCDRKPEDETQEPSGFMDGGPQITDDDVPF